jgi:hypothetical protein
MRTGTHFCTGGTEDFIKTVNNFYPAGKIAVFSDDREKAVNLIKFLGENYNALSYGTEEKPETSLIVQIYNRGRAERTLSRP